MHVCTLRYCHVPRLFETFNPFLGKAIAIIVTRSAPDLFESVMIASLKSMSAKRPPEP